MPDKAKATPSKMMLGALKDSGAIDHAKLGDVVAKAIPNVLSPGGLVADDYIARGYDSVVAVWKINPQGAGGLENQQALKAMGAAVAPAEHE